ncbi:MAG: STT3 domain-containing protein, partial [Methanobacterium sp.]|nr:STT3 domain-containing protein [Methanobacterium sp.]
FAFAWQGWWYIYYLIIASMVIYLIAINYVFHLKPKKSTDMLKGRLAWFNNKPEFFTFAVFIVLSIILMSIFLSVSGFLSALTEPITVNQLQATVQKTSYPNVYLTVGELKETKMDDVISGVGGILPFLFGFLGVLALCWKLRPQKEKKKISEEKTRKPRRRGKSNHRKEENKEYKTDKAIIKPDIGDQKSNYIFYIILFSIWLLITIYAMTKGVRFIENFALPITLTAGIFVGVLHDYVKDLITNTSYQTIVMVIIVILVAFSPLQMSYKQTSNVTPVTDDGMINSLEWLKNNTPNNTIITSWWDYGHLFTFVADRPVTFDGSSQNTPRAYWVGRALSTNNETLSVGIIRMLASTGDTATYVLANYTQSSGKSADILKNILGVDKETAISLMSTNYGLTSEQAQNVVMYTHPDNPASDIFITSHDMIGKAGAWAMLGNWNFTTNHANEYLSSEAVLGGVAVNNKTLFIGVNPYNGLWVAAQTNGTSMSAGVLNSANIANQDTNKILNQISTELTTGNGSIVVPPHKLTIINNENVTQTTVSNSSKFSIILFQQNNKYESFVISKELDYSMFMKLYIFGGEGLTHFKQLYGQPGVVVWSVNY